MVRLGILAYQSVVIDSLLEMDTRGTAIFSSYTRMAFQLCRMSHCDLSVLIYKCVHEHYEDSGCCGSFQKHLHTVCLVHSLQEATVRLLCLLFPAYLLKAASLVGVSFLPAVFRGTVLQLSVSASS